MIRCAYKGGRIADAIFDNIRRFGAQAAAEDDHGLTRGRIAP
jgi:hypothetical protein